MNSTAMTTDAAVERVQADHDSTKHLGRRTSANRFEVRARSGAVVLVLRSPASQDDVEIKLDVYRSVVKLLLAGADRVHRGGIAIVSAMFSRAFSGTSGRLARTAPARRSATRRALG